MTWSVRPGLAGILGVFFLLTVNQAFAFSIAPTNHQTITKEALSASNFTYTLPNGSRVTFSELSVLPIVKGNRNIDIYSLKDETFGEYYHFDDERFLVGQSILLQAKDQIILQLRDQAFGNGDIVRQNQLINSSAEILGNSLHTLQDYYSHSNWVEQGNHGINPNLGVKGKLLYAPSGEICSESAPGLYPHTSGDYLASGVTDCFSICHARLNKCAHGNVLTSSELLVLCPLTSIDPNCGINKDRGFRKNHVAAYNLAREHTAKFVKDIFDEVLSITGAEKNIAAKAVCQFMSVRDPINTCTEQYQLQVLKQDEVTGMIIAEGRVDSGLFGIDCGGTCEYIFIADSSITLAASSSGGFAFVKWADDSDVCAGSEVPICEVTMDAHKTVKAVFNQSKYFRFRVDGGPEQQYDSQLTSYHSSNNNFVACSYPSSSGACWVMVVASNFTGAGNYPLASTNVSGQGYLKLGDLEYMTVNCSLNEWCGDGIWGGSISVDTEFDWVTGSFNFTAVESNCPGPGDNAACPTVNVSGVFSGPYSGPQ